MATASDGEAITSGKKQSVLMRNCGFTNMNCAALVSKCHPPINIVTKGVVDWNWSLALSTLREKKHVVVIDTSRGCLLDSCLLVHCPEVRSRLTERVCVVLLPDANHCSCQ